MDGPTKTKTVAMAMAMHGQTEQKRALTLLHSTPIPTMTMLLSLSILSWAFFGLDSTAPESSLLLLPPSLLTNVPSYVLYSNIHVHTYIYIGLSQNFIQSIHGMSISCRITCAPHNQPTHNLGPRAFLLTRRNLFYACFKAQSLGEEEEEGKGRFCSQCHLYVLCVRPPCHANPPKPTHPINSEHVSKWMLTNWCNSRCGCTQCRPNSGFGPWIRSKCYHPSLTRVKAN